MEAYDLLAGIYDLWIRGDPARERCHAFYVDYCRSRPGVVVELGVGSGEIAVALAQAGRPVLGVDSSRKMIELCQRKARLAGVSERIVLLHADMIGLPLFGVTTMILPFRTLGHIVERDRRQQLFAAVFQQLAPGGLFVLDHYVPDLTWARKVNNVPQKMYEEEREGDELAIWDLYEFDLRRGLMHCFVSVERKANGSAREPVRIEFDFAWVGPDEIGHCAARAGFETVDRFGDFEKSPWTTGSSEQIWVLRRPA